MDNQGAHAAEGTAARKAGGRGGGGAEKHQEPLLGAGRAEDLALILFLECWHNYVSFAEGEPRLREVKLLATDPSESTCLNSVPCRLQMLHELPKTEEGSKPNSVSGACVVSTLPPASMESSVGGQ